VNIPKDKDKSHKNVFSVLPKTVKRCTQIESESGSDFHL